MSRALQKAIVYELFAIVLAIVVAAAAVAESVTAGYLTGPWILSMPGDCSNNALSRRFDCLGSASWHVPE